jgi:hypothetical protein
MVQAHIKCNNPYQIVGHVWNALKSLFFDTNVSMEMIKLNIHLE